MLMQVMIFPSSFMLFISGILCLAVAALMALFRPYSTGIHNGIDATLILLMGISFICYAELDQLTKLNQSIQWGVTVTIMVTSFAIMSLYFIFLILWKIFHLKIRTLIRTIRMNKASSRGGIWNRESIETVCRNNGRGFDASSGQLQVEIATY